MSKSVVEWADAVWDPLVLWPSKLEEPISLTGALKIFTGLHSDLWDDSVPFEYLDSIMDVVRRSENHTFQFLSRRTDRMAEYFLTRPPVGWPFPNAWLGVYAESQPAFNARMEMFKPIPAALKWLSYQPALGPINLRKALNIIGAEGSALWMPGNGARDLDWVVCGGEFGKNARASNPEWFRLVRDQCCAVGVPFFFSNWGEWAPDHHGSSISLTRMAVFHPEDTGEPPIYLRDMNPSNRSAWAVNAYGDTPMYMVGKKHSGRLLDGLECQEFPE